MSLNIVPLQPVVVRDQRFKVNEFRDYAVFEGAEQVTLNPFQTTSFSNDYMNFNVTTPGPRIFIDRKIYLKYTVDLTFTPSTAVAGTKVLQEGLDAFRAFPLSSCMTSISMKINGVGVSINPDQIINALLRYNTCWDVLNREYSECPSMLDNAQSYASMINSVRNPLGAYTENSAQITRGAFVLDSLTNGDVTATLRATITEPLFLSPLNFGQNNSGGFIGVQTLEFDMTMRNLFRMWSHINVAGGVQFNDASIAVNLSAPTLLLTYLTPKEIYPIPQAVPYSYYKVVNYQTNTLVSVAPGASATLISSTTQLPDVPRRLFIYAQRPKAGTGQQSVLTTDTFFSIENLSITWNNVNSVLASASKQDLYNISKKNGCMMSWDEWSGQKSYRLGTNAVGVADTSFALTGSVICIDMGEDIGLPSVLAPGASGNFSLQVFCTVTNVHPTDTITPTLNVVVISEGAFTILNNSAIPSTSVLSKEDVLKSSQMPILDINPIDQFYGGGFWSKLKDVGSEVFKGIKEVLPVARDIVKTGVEIAPYVAPLVGLGGGVVGGSVVGGCGSDHQSNPYMGGKIMTRSMMKRRMLQ